MSVRADRKSRQVVAWFKSTGTKDQKVRITLVLWNWCPVNERLPMTFTLPTGQSKTLRFTPTNSRVDKYGNTVELKYDVLEGGQVVEGGEVGPAPTWGSPSVGMIVKSVAAYAPWDVEFGIPAGVPPCHIREFSVRHGGAVLAKGLALKRYRKPTVFGGGPAIRPTLLSPGVWEIQPDTSFVIAEVKSWTKPIVAKFKWRPSPWAPWQPVTDTLPPP